MRELDRTPAALADAHTVTRRVQPKLPAPRAAAPPPARAVQRANTMSALARAQQPQNSVSVASNVRAGAQPPSSAKKSPGKGAGGMGARKQAGGVSSAHSEPERPQGKK
jgi:hypothetical protein